MWMCRRVALTLFVAMASFALMGQTATPAPFDIYTEALKEATREMHSHWPGIGSEFVLYLDGSPLASYPSVANGVSFRGMGSQELLKAAEKTKDGIWALRVLPATVEGAQVKVVVTRDLV